MFTRDDGIVDASKPGTYDNGTPAGVTEVPPPGDYEPAAPVTLVERSAPQPVLYATVTPKAAPSTPTGTTGVSTGGPKPPEDAPYVEPPAAAGVPGEKPGEPLGATGTATLRADAGAAKPEGAAKLPRWVPWTIGALAVAWVAYVILVAAQDDGK